jgi:putative hemolysin
VPYLIIFLLSLLNGIFAMAEVALISSRKVRLQTLAKEGNWRAKAALRLSSDPHRFLPTVQIGMTAVSIIAGAYGGTEVAGELSKQLSGIAWLGKSAELLGFILTITLTTFLTLVLGELVPKTIGIARPETVAMLLAPLMQLLYYVTAPFIWLLSISTKFILRLIRFRKKDDPPVTEDELKHLIEQGRQYGILEKQESDMMRSIIRTADRNVSSLMTHRTDVIWIDVNASPAEIMQTIQQTIHTNFPVCNKSLDQVEGIIFIKDILVHLNTEEKWDLRSVIKQPLFIPESMPALELLEKFRKSGMHVGLVLNEYGSLEGMVTLHDVVEAIFGDIPITHQSRDEAVQRSDGSWLIDGMMQTTRWNDVLGIHDLSDEDIGSYNTLGGFVMHHLGRIPQPGDHFESYGHYFEVMDMDGMRVDKVMVRKKISGEETE